MRELTIQHEPGLAVADFIIRFTQTVDTCSTLYVRIRAGNDAGMSLPSEPVKVGKLQNTLYVLTLYTIVY